MTTLKKLKKGTVAKGITQGTFTTATTATVVSSTSTSYYGVVFYNPSGNSTIYFGSSDVTTTDGLPLPADSYINFSISDLSQIYIVSGTAAQTVNYVVLTDG
ncbi:MAG: hypothetical protein JXA54_11310 [Candidatus Heimdallarchaeota archaeon]|nr:hypothetical protein [Candidatus Heimdallarchaeota archaeon]